jgi:hypothetical protein
MKLPLFLSALAISATALSAQTLVLPDNHNFMEASTYGTNAGDANCWSGTSAKRFQIIYEASHFLGKAGVLGPILITNIKFRGEDGESNLGGQDYSGPGALIVQLGQTSLTSATMVTTFGGPTGGLPTVSSNRDPAVTPILGPTGIASVLVAPSAGSSPNNYCINIDLMAAGAAFLYDPTLGNLLIDVTAPLAPVSTLALSGAPGSSMIPIQDTTAHGAGIRGKAVWTSTPASASGTADTTPPVVGIVFIGPGGEATEVPAKAEYIGGGCGGAHSTFYQAFTQDQAFDVTGITMIPDVYPAPTKYTVLPTSAPIDLSKLNAVANTTGDDTVLTTPTGFLVTPFAIPGSTTASLAVCANGWVGTVVGGAYGTTYLPTQSNFLGTGTASPPRFMPYFTDLNGQRNTGGDVQAGLHTFAVPETFFGAGDAKLYITWYKMGSFRVPTGSATVYNHASWTFQMVIHENTGVVEYRYGAMQPFNSTLWTPTLVNAAVVGFSLGRIGATPSLDPQSRDLSNELTYFPSGLPYMTSVEGVTSNVSLRGVVTTGIPGSATQTGRMFGGQALKWDVDNLPPAPLTPGFHLVLVGLSFGILQPGVDLGSFAYSNPGCIVHDAGLNPIIIDSGFWPVAGGTFTGTPGVFPILHAWDAEGVSVTVQAFAIDLTNTSPGLPYLVPWTSNAIKYTIGLD